MTPFVIARSECDEAIQESLPGAKPDCFAEPVIGPRIARTRWPAMTKFPTAGSDVYSRADPAGIAEDT
jgi:hypothetical protein